LFFFLKHAAYNRTKSILQSTQNITINAVAGSGKTTTLIEFAKVLSPQSSILYLAFNKSVKIEAEKNLKKPTYKMYKLKQPIL
jgi:superfamily I DNA and RNA helicase